MNQRDSERWLIAIRDTEDESERRRMVEDFYFLTRPVVRRVACTLARHSRLSGERWCDDIELVVTESLFSVVLDVTRGDVDPACGRALYYVLMFRARARFRRLVRAQAYENAAHVAPLTASFREVTADLYLDRPHMVLVQHAISGDTRHLGPFDGLVSALQAATRVEASLGDRDPNWRVAPVPLVDPDTALVGLGRVDVGGHPHT